MHSIHNISKIWKRIENSKKKKLKQSIEREWNAQIQKKNPSYKHTNLSHTHIYAFDLFVTPTNENLFILCLRVYTRTHTTHTPLKSCAYNTIPTFVSLYFCVSILVCLFFLSLSMCECVGSFLCMSIIRWNEISNYT